MLLFLSVKAAAKPTDPRNIRLSQTLSLHSQRHLSSRAAKTTPKAVSAAPAGNFYFKALLTASRSQWHLKGTMILPMYAEDSGGCCTESILWVMWSLMSHAKPMMPTFKLRVEDTKWLRACSRTYHDSPLGAMHRCYK